MSVKDYIEEVLLLPPPVKIGACIVTGILVLSLIYAGLSNYALSKKAEKLEKANVELQSQIDVAAKRAAVAETLAADEKERGDNLESQLPQIESKGKNQDEKIVVQKSNTETLRRRLDSIRRGKLPESANSNARTGSQADVEDFERKIANRYENSNR